MFLNSINEYNATYHFIISTFKTKIKYCSVENLKKETFIKLGSVITCH